MHTFVESWMKKMFLKICLTNNLFKRQSFLLTSLCISINVMLVREITQSLSELSLRLDFGGFSMIKKKLRKWTLCGPNWERIPSWIPSLVNSRKRSQVLELMALQLLQSFKLLVKWSLKRRIKLPLCPSIAVEVMA